MSPRCFELDGVSPFAPRAADYARARPGYPAEAIERILFGLVGPRLRIVDVGAGTTQATRQLAAHAGFAIGIDPSREMLQAAPPTADVALLCASAEHLPLRSGAVDLLTAFNAFHWFEPAAFFAEARRVLAPAGRLALVWNDWDLRDAFTASFVSLMRAHAGAHPAEARETEIAPLYDSPLFRDVSHHACPHRHGLDAAGVSSRMRSVSYVPADGPAWNALEQQLRALFERHADASGAVTHHYVTNVFVAAPR